jgi:hypothetical protein
MKQDGTWGTIDIKWFIDDQAFSSPCDLTPLPPTTPLLFYQKARLTTHVKTGERGGGGAKLYDSVKAWSSINHSVLSGGEPLSLSQLRSGGRTQWRRQQKTPDLILFISFMHLPNVRPPGTTVNAHKILCWVIIPHSCQHLSHSLTSWPAVFLPEINAYSADLPYSFLTLFSSPTYRISCQRISYIKLAYHILVWHEQISRWLTVFLSYPANLPYSSLRLTHIQLTCHIPLWE